MRGLQYKVYLIRKPVFMEQIAGNEAKEQCKYPIKGIKKSCRHLKLKMPLYFKNHVVGVWNWEHRRTFDDSRQPVSKTFFYYYLPAPLYKN